MSNVVLRGRISYAHIFEPHAMDGQDPKYSLSLIIPKDDEATIERAKKAINAAVQEGIDKKWKMRRDMLSRAYTTSWKDIISVR